MSNQPLLFWLGSFSELSQAELKSVLPRVEWQIIKPHILAAVTPDQLEPNQIMPRLGGLVRILRQIDIIDTVESDKLEKIISDYLYEHRDHKLTFAITSLDRDHLVAINSKSIKENLTNQGVSSRFVDSGEDGLSSAVWSHHRVTEIICIHLPETSQTLLAETVACQDVDDWTLRDRGKPYASHSKGLLPPKLARIMVNLAVGENPSDNTTLVDPFCGSGTVLMEALTIGLSQVIGGDADPEAATGAKHNLEWFVQAVPHQTSLGQFEVKLADATHLAINQPIQYLVTEPFMGKVRFQPNHVPGMVKGLQKLYLGAFKNWTNFLAPKAKIVFIFPSFVLSTGQTITTADGMLDKLASLGYTLTSGKLDYSRPQAGVVRQIYQFVYQPLN